MSVGGDLGATPDLSKPRNYKLRSKGDTVVVAEVYDQTTNTWRESSLDMDYCLSRDYAGGDHSYWAAARAPKDFKDPKLEHTTVNEWRISDVMDNKDEYGEKVNMMLEGYTIHIRNEIYIPIFPNKVTESYIELPKYIRGTKTGHMEFVHPPYDSYWPEWLETVLGAAGAISKIPSSGFEAFVDLAKDELTKGLVPGVTDENKRWMEDTYVDGNQLIRHGR